MAWLNLILSRAGAYVAAGVALLLGLLTVLSKAKKAGRDEVVAKVAEQEIKNAQTAKDVDSTVDRTKPADVQRELHDNYSRD